MRHNGSFRVVTDFTLNGTVASGYVGGKFISGDVTGYAYAGYKDKCIKCRTETGLAKHFLVDLHDALYGDAPSLVGYKSEAHANTRRKCRIRNTHIVNLGNGTCIATGEVDGVPTSIEFNGYAENGYNGTLMEAKPYLGPTRKALIEKYDKEQAKKAADKLVEFKAKYPHLIAEVMADLLA